MNTAPFHTFYMPVSPLHTLYVEQFGNPEGVPVLFLHGGPGAGLSPKHRNLFDPTRFRAILFDQRGAGRSTPFASLEDNTTWALVEDIEKIRQHLGIERWLVLGGSWGSTLALAYAQTHPERVLAMVLRGLFLCRQEEIRWFYQEGCHYLSPHFWEAFLAPIPPEERHDMVSAYYKRLTSPDKAVQQEAALAWAKWEEANCKLNPEPNAPPFLSDPHTALSLARVECHYFMNNAFFTEENALMNRMERIAHLPVTLIHGRYDLVCPPKNAWDVHKALPNSELHLIPNAGHASDEPGIFEAQVKALDVYHELYRAGGRA